MENLARYIIRASFSQERMTYLPDESKVVYRSKDGKSEKTFDALEWLAAMPACACGTQTGVPMFPPKAGKPNKGEQMVRYYGYYSNVSRGRRKNSDQDALVPCILQPEESSKGYRKNWARLIQKIYEVDPLACPRCKGEMRIMAFIEGEEVIKKGSGEHSIIRPPLKWAKPSSRAPFGCCLRILKTSMRPEMNTNASRKPCNSMSLYPSPTTSKKTSDNSGVNQTSVQPGLS